MNFGKLKKIAEDLSGKVSRFELAELTRDAERGKGPLADLTRFEIAYVKNLYERNRLKEYYKNSKSPA